MKKLFLIAAFAGLLLSGCSKEGYNANGLKDGYGAVAIGLESSGTFTETKAGSEAVDEFYVKILSGETVVKSYSKYRDVPNAVEIAPGTYTIEAGTSNNSPAAFNEPVFYGSGEFTVSAGAVVPVDLTCTLRNMKVTIRYTEAFGNEVAADFEIVVTNGIGTLLFDKTIIDEGYSGYFSVAPLSIRLNGKRKSTGEEILHSIEIPDGKAKDHFVLTFDAQETGDIQFGQNGTGGITIDWTVNDRQQEVVVPGEDETPVPDEGDGSEDGDGGNEGGDGNPVEEYLPTITGDGIGTPVKLTAAEASTAVVDVLINTLNNKTIKDVIVKIDSPTLTEEFMSGMDLGASEFSIVNFSSDSVGQTRKACLLELGLISESKPIYGKSEYTFSIGGFMPMLIAIAKSGDEHKFIIKVKDSGDKIATATCVIIKKES